MISVNPLLQEDEVNYSSNIFSIYLPYRSLLYPLRIIIFLHKGKQVPKQGSKMLFTCFIYSAFGADPRTIKKI